MTNTTNTTDWLEITIKFRGKCSECGKEITSGLALWSKSTKAVKHIECSARTVNQAIAGTNPEEYITHELEKKGFSTARQRKYLEHAIELKCFICGNKTMLTNENDDYTDYNDYYKDKSYHAYICQSCLKREDVYEAYQQSFLQKINKYLE